MTITRNTTAHSKTRPSDQSPLTLRFLAACLAAALLLGGCGNTVTSSDTGNAAVTADADSDEIASGWESIPGTAGDTDDVAAASSDTADSGSTSAGAERGADSAHRGNPAAMETTDSDSTDSLWDEIPDEDSWGPFPAGEELSLCYAYQQLSGEEQQVYAELRRMIRTREETNLSSLDKDAVNRIYDAVLIDHPELFYISGYTITSHTRNGALEYLSAHANYIYNEEETAEYARLIDTAVDSILLQAPTEGSDYEKVKFCYEYLIRNTDYDMDAENHQNIISVFLNHASVCNGYAKALQYLLLKMDVPATVVTGESAGSAHAWDLVCIGGQYYYVDPTWGDAQFTGASDSSTNLWITYDYLNITTADILTNHTLDNTIPLPVCADTTYNYYVQEGLYFTSFDTALLHRIVNAAYEDGSLTVRLRCATAEVYNEMVTALIDNKGIYDYLYQANAISYTQSDALHTLAIMIR